MTPAEIRAVKLEIVSDLGRSSGKVAAELYLVSRHTSAILEIGAQLAELNERLERVIGAINGLEGR